MTSGGVTRMTLENDDRYSPASIAAALMRLIGAAAGPLALNGTSGSRVSRSFTSSMPQNMPTPRTSPIDG